MVPGDLAAVLEDEHPIELDVVEQRPPGGHRIERRDREARVEAGQERGQEGVGAGPVDHPGQTELDHQAVLEGAPQALDPALGLGRAGQDRIDVELDEGAPDLAQGRLVVDRLARLGSTARTRCGRRDRWRPAGRGSTIVVAQDLEIAGGVLLVAEDRRRDPTGRIVDGADEGELRAAPLEPLVAAAVELEERPLGAHPLPPAAIARRAAPARAGDPFRRRMRAQGLAADSRSPRVRPAARRSGCR